MLLKALYGRCTAPKRWNKKLTSVLDQSGLESCDAQPSPFYSKRTDVSVEVQIDDFDIAEPDDAVNELLNELSKGVLMKIGKPVGPSCRSELLGRKNVRTADRP